MRCPLVTNIRFMLVVAAIIALSATSPLAAEKVVAKVGEVPITEFEVTREQNKLMPLNATFHGGMSADKINKVREEALAHLIERAYKISYAQSSGIALEKGVFDKRFEQIQKAYPSYKAFKKATGKEGVDGVRASLQREMLALRAEQVAVDEKIKIEDAEVKAHFEKNQSNYMHPRQYRVSHIIIKVDPASNPLERAALLKKAQELVARARGGEDFYNLAYNNSDRKTDEYFAVGGDLGYLNASNGALYGKKGKVTPEYQEALEKMKPGEVSDPIRTLVGYHILKLTEKREPHQFSFEEVRDRIRQTLHAKKREAAYAEWMSGLKAKFAVKRF